MRPELLEGLTPEQIAKVKSCNDPKELLKLIEEEDVCLNEAQLAAVSGGGCGGGGSIECPDCHSTEFKELSPKSVNGIVTYYYRCKKCGKVWYEI
ncbi:MAG: hypothetical protein J6A47_06685 [Bacilli bacterium]|nr:hypothetical protein [Bacilli bacterium]MBO6284997.1 hypothetical protein [Bacilli bacterium]